MSCFLQEHYNPWEIWRSLWRHLGKITFTCERGAWAFWPFIGTNICGRVNRRSHKSAKVTGVYTSFSFLWQLFWQCAFWPVEFDICIQYCSPCLIVVNNICLPYLLSVTWRINLVIQRYLYMLSLYCSCYASILLDVICSMCMLIWLTEVTNPSV